MSEALQAVRGMNDILPGESAKWEAFELIIRDWVQSYGYQPIRMPLVEHTALFRRGIGEVTDVVEKEMYSFEDALNGEHLSLRPEGTASCVRSVIQHNLLATGAKRLFYYGPMFRHERPQKGRYRQFHQVGVEALGHAGPDVDAELIIMTSRLWKILHLDNIRLEINSLGNIAERQQHRAALISYFEQHRGGLDEAGLRRLHSNPLRILDTKNPQMQSLAEQAPKLMDFLGEESLRHFDALCTLLAEAQIDYRINHRLVRGLDYYNLTVFEWITDQLGAQGTVCAGGRYDVLMEQLGGKPAPAAGFAMGVERLLALWQNEDYKNSFLPDVYVVSQGANALKMAFCVAESLRNHGIRVLMHCGGGSFRSQMKKADTSGAALAVILGENEVQAGEAGIKALRREEEQLRVPLLNLADRITQFLSIKD